MNRYMIIHRLRWPSLLLLTGILALLDQAGVLHFWHFWPLYLILLGVLALAERASMPSAPSSGYPYGTGYPGSEYGTGYAAQAGYAPPVAAPPAPESSSTSIVPASNDVESLTKEPRKSWDEEGR